jgi:hypothetical protein
MTSQYNLFPTYLKELQAEAAERKQVRVEELKQIDFLKDFDADWIERFADVEQILKYLQTYPELAKVFKGDEFVKPEDLLKNQEEWMSLYSKYTGMEKGFFKPNWVPFITGSYDYFFDLSDYDLPVFETAYYFLEPNQYLIFLMFNKATDLMKAAESGFNSSDFFALRLLKINEQSEIIKKQREQLKKKKKK